jgi:predicted membrane protein
VAAIAAVVTAFAWFDVNLGDGVGESTYAPASIASVQKSYHLGVGNLKVDLSQVNPVGRHRIDARVGVGELRIIVPRNANVHVNAQAKVGDVFVLRQHVNGRNVSVQSGSGQFEIDAQVGAGRIDVVRAR